MGPGPKLPGLKPWPRVPGPGLFGIPEPWWGEEELATQQEAKMTFSSMRGKSRGGAGRFVAFASEFHVLKSAFNKPAGPHMVFFPVWP